MREALHILEYGHPIRRSQAECVDRYQEKDATEGGASLWFRFFAWLYFDRRGRSWLIDTGCTAATAEAFGKVVDSEIPELLNAYFDLQAEQIDHVILTHLHYDHADNIEPFVNARIFVQQAELAHLYSDSLGGFSGDEFYVGRTRQDLDVLAAQERLSVIDGQENIDDGVSVLPLPGHAPGLQGVKLDLPDGPVMLASDAAHTLANLEIGRPFPKSFDLNQGVASISTLTTLASEGVVVVPGHALPSSMPDSVRHVQSSTAFQT